MWTISMPPFLVEALGILCCRCGESFPSKFLSPPPAHSSAKLKPLLIPSSVIKKSDNNDFCCLMTAYRLVDVIASLTQAPLSPAIIFPRKSFKRAPPLGVCRVVVPSSTLTNHRISTLGNLKTGLTFWIVFKQRRNH